MLKFCHYCGRIHDKSFDCGRKPKDKRSKYKDGELTPEDRIRKTNRWKRKSLEIRQRDTGLCQVCLRNLYNTTSIYTIETLEVHHIEPLNQNIKRAYDNHNLITICKYHHNMAEYGEIPQSRLHAIAAEQERKNKLIF